MSRFQGACDTPVAFLKAVEKGAKKRLFWGESRLPKSVLRLHLVGLLGTEEHVGQRESWGGRDLPRG